MAGAGFAERDGVVKVRPVTASSQKALHDAGFTFHLVSNRDQLRDFHQKSEMIRFSFYTAAPWTM